MSYIRSKDTSLELKLQHELWRQNDQRLESNAWNVITVWEYELDKAHL